MMSPAAPMLAVVAVNSASHVSALGPLCFMIGGYLAVISFFVFIHLKDEYEKEQARKRRIEEERIAEEKIKAQLWARHVDCDKIKRKHSWSEMLALIDFMNGPMHGTNHFGISKWEILNATYPGEPMQNHARDLWTFDNNGNLYNHTQREREDKANESAKSSTLPGAQ